MLLTLFSNDFLKNSRKFKGEKQGRDLKGISLILGLRYAKQEAQDKRRVKHHTTSEKPVRIDLNASLRTKKVQNTHS